MAPRLIGSGYCCLITDALDDLQLPLTVQAFLHSRVGYRQYTAKSVNHLCLDY